MSAAAAATANHGHSPDGHFLPTDAGFGNATTGKIGMWVFLVSDAFSFGGLLLAYGILRGGASLWRGEDEPSLGINFTAALTFLLICSSVSMVMAVAAATERNRAATTRWLAVTALGGALFLLGQMQEYFGVLHGLIPGMGEGLVHEGLVLKHSAYAATFYVTTSFHGMHVLSGTIYLTVMAVRSHLGKTDANDIEVLGLFWHFVDLVWILVFTFVYLL